MDFAAHWKQLLSENRDIQGGALFTGDAVLISSAGFGSSDDHTSVARCAALVAIARQLSEDAGCGAFDSLVLEGRHGYLILMPVVDHAIFAALARKQARLGLALLDVRRAIDDFSPGLAAELIPLPYPPAHDSAHARPE